MNTVSIGRETVIRNRRRLAQTATNAKTSREVFGDQSTKNLAIPAFIDDYNHYIGAVDQADQLRSYYTTVRRHNKNWKPLWHFLLDTTTTNCFKLYRHHSETAQAHSLGHKDFLIKLVIDLFDYSERISAPAPSIPKPLIQYVVPDMASQHQHGLLSKRPKSCIVCRAKGKRPSEEGTMKRKALGELSRNIARPDRPSIKRPLEMKRTTWGCRLCKQPICKQGGCWSDHIEVIQQ